MNDLSRFIVGIIIGLLIFGFGLLVIAPDIYWGESAIITNGSWHLGSANPPGYSGFIQIIHIFQTWLSLGSIPFRGNVAGLLFLSLFGITLFHLLNRLHVKNCLSIPVTLGFCFSLPVMDASMAVEVYSFHLLMLAILSYLLITEIPLNKRLYLLAFLSALMMTHHLTSLLLMPGLALAILSKHRTNLKYSFLGPIILFLIMGFSGYLFLPVRDALIPELVWGYSRKWSGFFSLITATEEATGAFLSGLMNMNSVLFRAKALFDALRAMITIPGMVIAFLGAIAFHKRFKSISVFCITSLILLLFAVVIYDSHESISFFLPGFMIIWLWFAFGTNEISNMLTGRFKMKSIYATTLFCVVASALLFHNGRQSYQNRAYDVFVPGVLVRRSLDMADENSMIISRRSDWCFLHWYAVHTEKRNNVSAIYQPLLSFSWYYQSLLDNGLAYLILPEESFEDTWSWNTAVTASLSVQNLTKRTLRWCENEIIRDMQSAGFEYQNMVCSLLGVKIRRDITHDKILINDKITFPGRLDPMSTRILGYKYYQYAECLVRAGKDQDAAIVSARAENYYQHGVQMKWWD